VDSLAIISESAILKQSDLDSIVAIKDELLKSMDTVQMFRTRTEMLVSVLKDINHPTPDSKYWQAVKEQSGMFHSLVMLSYGYRENAVEIKKLQRDHQAEHDDLEKELIQIRIEKRQFAAMGMEREARERIREIKEWSNIKGQLMPHLKHGDMDVNAHELEALNVSYARKAQMVTPQTAVADARNILGIAEMARKYAK